MFEFVKKYEDCGLALPERKTSDSAGYDLAAAQDIIIPSLWEMYKQLNNVYLDEDNISTFTLPLEDMAYLTKKFNLKPTLVSTGLKCKLPEGTYLELSVRSSTPLKYWLILANGVGVIDRDYYNNESNEGEIFLQLINLSPFPIKIQKGDLIGQAIVKPYLTLEGDCASGVRTGGFGSTSTQSESSAEDALRRMIT